HHIEIANNNTDKQHFNSSKYSIQMILAKILLQQGDYEGAAIQTEHTITQLLMEKTGAQVALKDMDFTALKDLVSDNFINIFSSAGHLYLEVYKSTENEEQLLTAEKLLVIAAKLFNEYYLKGEFNEVLDYYHQRITEGLLTVAVSKNASSD